MTEDKDRDAILARRRRLLASALSGVAMGAMGLGAQACTCLSPPPPDSGEDATPMGCLSQDAGAWDSGPADAGSDAGAEDAGSEDAGLDDAGADAAG